MDGEQLVDAAVVKSALDAVPVPVFIADFDVRILFVNRAGRALAGGDGVLDLRRAGEVLGCLRATETEAGCGNAPGCRRCVVRNSVSKAVFNGAVHRVRAFLEVARGGKTEERYFLVSAAPFEHEGRRLAILTLEDISEIVELRSMIPVCAGCGKIRDEENHWKKVEHYFHERLDVDFSHGFCESCVDRLYPEVGKKLRDAGSH